MKETDGEAEDYQERCSTWLEAERQHHAAVEVVNERKGAEWHT